METKHFVTVEFYGRRYRIGIVAKSRSEAIVQALAKARAKIKITSDSSEAAANAETYFANTATILDFGSADDMNKKFNEICSAAKDPEFGLQKCKTTITELAVFFQSIVDAIELAELQENK